MEDCGASQALDALLKSDLGIAKENAAGLTWATGDFHLFKNICYFPLLVLKGIYHLGS